MDPSIHLAPEIGPCHTCSPPRFAHAFVPPPPGMEVRICYEVLQQLGPDGAEICGGLEAEHSTA